MMPVGASGESAMVMFVVIDENGERVATKGSVGNPWTVAAPGLTSDAIYRLPNASSYTNMTINNIVNLGDGDYGYKLTQAQTLAGAGKVCARSNIAGYDNRKFYDDIVDLSSATGEKLDTILALLHYNARLDKTVYNDKGLMVSARLRVFASAAAASSSVAGAADGADGETMRFLIGATDAGDGKLGSYKLTRAA